MKRIFIITILATICGMTAMAQDRPDVTQQTTGGNHNDIPTFSVARPSLTYNAADHEIIVNGMAEYYSVEVKIASNLAVVFTTTVEGDMGVIDVSALANDVYIITLTDDNNRLYRYTFDVGLGVVKFRGLGNTVLPNLPNNVDHSSRR